jgi:hypothetical protein
MKLRLYIARGLFYITFALLFVMPRFSYGVGRTALNAFSTCALGKKQAVGMMIVIGPICGRDFDLGHNGTTTHGLPSGGNQAVTKTKSSQSGGIGSMSL